MQGAPKFAVSQDITDFPHDRYAELIGLGGIWVDAPAAAGAAWDEALPADGPVVIEAITDPATPTLPPELTPDQAEMIGRALAAGDPDASAVRRQLEKAGYHVGAAETG